MRKVLYGLLIMLTACLSSCVEEEQYADNPHGNFEALWKLIDEHYCFFEYKNEVYGLDWDRVHDKYARMIEQDMTERQLFEVLGNMLGELRDGHVNMWSPFDMARYWSWREDYPQNFSDSIQRRYLGTDYHITGGAKYRVLDDNVGYVYWGSFDFPIGNGSLDEIINELMTCNSIIIDVRNNGGGMMTTAEKIAARFTDNTITVGYMQHKTGKGHNDFSDMRRQELKPSSSLRWHKPVAILTNRSVYSAANEFVKYMKCCPNVITVGDKTGGGAGMPFTGEIPNGWNVRFSACPMFDKDGNSVEFGIAPDYKVDITSEDYMGSRDTILEFARKKLAEL